MKEAKVAFVLVALWLCGVATWAFDVGCSADVKVHGIPEEIALRAPFCAPPPAEAGAVDADSE